MLKLLGAVAVLVVIAAGCGSDDPPPRPASEPLPTPPPSESTLESPGWDKEHSAAVRRYYGGGDRPPDPRSDVEAEYHQPPRPATGGIGDTITLTGTNIGVRLRVTVTGLVDPAATVRSPRPGMRYVGVGLRLRSTGIAIHESRLKAALLRHSGGRAARPVFGVKAGCSNGFDGVVRLDGPRTRGCLLFQLPESARPRELVLALEELPAEVGGRWRLR